MSLSLPGDIEPFLSDKWDSWSNPAVYALTLSRPENVREAWDREFDVRPPYLDDLETCDRALYVGAANDLLHRLEDHARGDKRRAALLRVCDVEGLRNVWWYDDADEAFMRESKIAIELQNERPSWYIHSR